MKRRDVVKLGAIAAGAGAGMPGCAVPRPVSTMTGGDGPAQFIAMLDQQLARTSRPGLLQRLIDTEPGAERSPEVEARLAEKDALFRRMIGTLLVTQGFRELPPETQLDPAVQARMWSHMDEIGATVFEVTDMLAALDETQRARLRTTLDRQPDLPMDLGEMLDAQAAGAGISGARRRQLRQMMSQTSFRMRHGDPAAIIDEYVEKVARLDETTSRHGDALRLAKQLGERSFWRYQHLVAQQGGQPPAPAQPAPTAPAPTVPGPPSSQPYPTVPVPPAQPAPGAQEQPPPPPPRMATPTYAMEEPKPKPRAGERGLRVGGYMLGIGVVVGGLSLLLVESSEVFLFGLTAGALLFAIGLLTIVISAIIMASG